jgi:type I restriction enzyme, S subunit
MIQVPDGWEIKPFSSLASINMGQSPESEFVNENQEGIAFLQGNADFGDINPKELYWVKVPKKLAKKDDILISVRAPVGDMNMADKEYCIGRGLSALTIKKINQKFGFYALFQERIQLDRLAQGSTFLAIGKNDFDKLLIKYPKEIKEQEKIAKILSTLDNAIESTNRIIEKEKNIKTALMQELLTNGIDKNGQIRTPQTHAYKQTELGLIPDEWEATSINLLLKNLDSKRIPLKEGDRQEINGQYPYYGASGIIDWVDDYIFDGEYILLGEDGENVVSRVLPLAFKATGKIWVNNHAHVFQCKKDVNIDYIVNLLESTDYKSIINGSAQPKITQDGLNKLFFKIAPKNEQKQIARILNTQDKKIEREERNLAKLKELKKGLMTDLLSGVVRVKV